MIIRIKTQEQQYLVVLWSYIISTSLPYTFRQLVCRHCNRTKRWMHIDTQSQRGIQSQFLRQRLLLKLEFKAEFPTSLILVAVKVLELELVVDVLLVKVVVLISYSRMLVSLALAPLVLNHDVCLRFFSGPSMPANFFNSFPLSFWSRSSLRSSLMNFFEYECIQAFLSWQLFSSLWSSDWRYIHNFHGNCTQTLVGNVAESSLVHCFVWRYAGKLIYRAIGNHEKT